MDDRNDFEPPDQPSEDPPSEYEEIEQLECPDCNRKFNPIPYQKHIKICAKVFLTKRKAFDSAQMRIADNPELVKILTEKEKKEKQAMKKASKQSVKSHTETPVGNNDNGRAPKWKEQSNAFREAMKAARQVTVALATGAPLPPPKMSAPDPSLIPCPHCGRSFNERAAERHIPQCQNIRAKPTSLKRATGSGIGSKPVANKPNMSSAPAPKPSQNTGSKAVNGGKSAVGVKR